VYSPPIADHLIPVSHFDGYMVDLLYLHYHKGATVLPLTNPDILGIITMRVPGTICIAQSIR